MSSAPPRSRGSRPPSLARRLSPLLLPLLVSCAASEAKEPARPVGGATKGLLRTSQLTGQTEVLPLRVLAVGVSDFKHLALEDDLPTGEADARWFVDELSRVVEPAEKPVVLTGAQATYKAVEGAVVDILEGARPGEVVMLFFATHGATVRNAGYLLTFDSVPEGKLPFTSLSTARITQALKKTVAEQVLILADTVHQALVGPKGLTSGPDSNVDAVLGALAAEGRKAGKQVLVLTGNQVRTAARKDDPCAGHGAFTCTLVGAMLGRADRDNDQLTSFAEVVEAVPAVFAATGQGSQSAQRPLGWGDADRISLPVVPAVLAQAPSPLATGTRWSTVVTPEVRICYLANEQLVATDHVFRTGDRFAARVTVPEAGQLAMVNVGPDGHAEVLFPLPGEDNGVGRGATVQVMPGNSDDPIVVVDPAGQEKVYVLWAPLGEPLADERTLLAIASQRAATGTMASAAAPDEAWRVGTKSLGRSPRVERAGEICDIYKPEQQGRGWAVELTLDHR
ncbi:MAG: DUF4384 domain-containing protein [Pseudomonadota bacterium]|nr:DUF4384 domain-containing protein [Pseudomonadota bacterium]